MTIYFRNSHITQASYLRLLSISNYLLHRFQSYIVLHSEHSIALSQIFRFMIHLSSIEAYLYTPSTHVSHHKHSTSPLPWKTLLSTSHQTALHKAWSNGLCCKFISHTQFQEIQQLQSQSPLSAKADNIIAPQTPLVWILTLYPCLPQ